MVDENGTAKLTDIGIDTVPTPPDFVLQDAEVSRWLAPEIIDPPATSEDNDINDINATYTTKSDIYSFGMTMLEVLLLLLRRAEYESDADTRNPYLCPHRCILANLHSHTVAHFHTS